MKITVKDVSIISIFAALLFVQEQLLSFLPIQLTMLLIMLYSRVFKLNVSIIIVLIHVVLDNVYNGSFNLMYTPAMLIGWETVVVVTHYFLKKCKNRLVLASTSILFSIFYSFMFFLVSVLFFKADPIAYLLNDIWFTVILALSSFITILWLLLPLEKILNTINK